MNILSLTRYVVALSAVSILFAGCTNGGGLQVTPIGNALATTTDPQRAHVSQRPAGAKIDDVLYSFQGSPDGSDPSANLLADSSGVLYGTTTGGGTMHNGTVFKLTPSGGGYTESVLYNFQGGSDGAHPYSSLIADARGALYGTTAAGGTGVLRIWWRNGL